MLDGTGCVGNAAAAVLATTLAAGAIWTVTHSAERFSWSAPTSCPSAEHIDARIGSLGAGVGEAAFTASADVEPLAEGRYRARIHVQTPAAALEREVDADDCQGLADAVALVVAIHVDVLAVAQTAGPIVPSPPSLAEPPEPAASSVPPIERSVSVRAVEPATAPARRTSVSSESTRPTPRWRGAVFAATGVALGFVPATSLHFDLGVAALYGPLRLEALGTYVLAQRSNLTGRNGGADVDLGSAGVRVGFAPALRWVEFPLHVGLRAGDLRARGRGVQNARTRHGLWVAAELGAGVAFVFHPRFALTMRSSLLFALRRPRFRVALPNGPQPLPGASALAFSATIGPELRFP